MPDPDFQLAIKLLADSLAIDVDQLPADPAINNLPRWDSLAHMRLIMAIEQHNGEELDAATMVSISSLTDIANALR